MRSQLAESKVAAEIKLSEAHKIMEDAQKKLKDAEKKFMESESSSSESRRYERMTEIKLHDVEAREDELRRRLILFNSQLVICLYFQCSFICQKIEMTVFFSDAQRRRVRSLLRDKRCMSPRRSCIKNRRSC